MAHAAGGGLGGTVANSLDGRSIPVNLGEHPKWCDRTACRAHPPGDIGPAFVVHALVLLDHDGYLVALRQHDFIDAVTGGQLQREPARVLVAHDGDEVANVADDHADMVRASRGRSRQGNRAFAPSTTRRRRTPHRWIMPVCLRRRTGRSTATCRVSGTLTLRVTSRALRCSFLDERVELCALVVQQHVERAHQSLLSRRRQGCGAPTATSTILRPGLNPGVFMPAPTKQRQERVSPASDAESRGSLNLALVRARPWCRG